MKRLFFRSWILLLFMVLLISCHQTNEPTVDPIPEMITNPKEIYASYIDCLSGVYENLSSVILKRENRKKETYTINDYYHETYTNEDNNDTEFYSTAALSSDNVIIQITLSGYSYGNTGLNKEQGIISIDILSPEYTTYTIETSIIHSGDKLYLKDEKTQAYICVLQKGVGIIYMEDNAGHTWNAL